ncbi:hypothetical protein Fmac_030389 [Flemingia macrophylla]|uniref:Uncharacterized protein n=1 Tax=Flemingia macrophylla TaxID=520843 RepID=A0ABD1KZ15_9FABA
MVEQQQHCLCQPRRFPPTAQPKMMQAAEKDDQYASLVYEACRDAFRHLFAATRSPTDVSRNAPAEAALARSATRPSDLRRKPPAPTSSPPRLSLAPPMPMPLGTYSVFFTVLCMHVDEAGYLVRDREFSFQKGKLVFLHMLTWLSARFSSFLFGRTKHYPYSSPAFPRFSFLAFQLKQTPLIPPFPSASIVNRWKQTGERVLKNNRLLEEFLKLRTLPKSLHPSKVCQDADHKNHEKLQP